MKSRVEFIALISAAALLVLGATCRSPEETDPGLKWDIPQGTISCTIDGVARTFNSGAYQSYSTGVNGTEVGAGNPGDTGEAFFVDFPGQDTGTWDNSAGASLVCILKQNWYYYFFGAVANIGNCNVTCLCYGDSGKSVFGTFSGTLADYRSSQHTITVTGGKFNVIREQ